MKRQGCKRGVGHSASTQIDKLRHRMFLYQYLEDYSSNFLDYTLVFESLKHSVILIAFWLAVLFLDCQQSPVPPLFCSCVRRKSRFVGLSVVTGDLSCSPPLEAKVWCELAACLQVSCFDVPCCMRADIWPSRSP